MLVYEAVLICSQSITTQEAAPILTSSYWRYNHQSLFLARYHSGIFVLCQCIPQERHIGHYPSPKRVMGYTFNKGIRLGCQSALFEGVGLVLRRIRWSEIRSLSC